MRGFTSGCEGLSGLLALWSSLGTVVSMLGGLRNRFSSCCWLSLRLWMMLHDCCCFCERTHTHVVSVVHVYNTADTAREQNTKHGYVSSVKTLTARMRLRHFLSHMRMVCLATSSSMVYSSCSLANSSSSWRDFLMSTERYDNMLHDYTHTQTTNHTHTHARTYRKERYLVIW